MSLPTWNFSVVHVYGTPQVFDGREAFKVVEHTIEHFESAQDPRWRLTNETTEYAQEIMPRTLPFRLRANRILAKAKLSQDKAPDVQNGVIRALERPGPHSQPRLAHEMRRALDLEA